MMLKTKSASSSVAAEVCTAFGAFADYINNRRHYGHGNGMPPVSILLKR
jgi:hypothetical protein